MKPIYEIAINTSIDAVLVFSFHEYIVNQSEGFGNLASGMVWTLLVLMFISSLVPVDKWGPQRDKSFAEKSFHFITGLAIIGVCFYLGWFVTGGCYLGAWICYKAKQDEFKKLTPKQNSEA